MSSALLPTSKVKEEGAQKVGGEEAAKMEGSHLWRNPVTGPGHKMFCFGGIHWSVTRIASFEQN